MESEMADFDHKTLSKKPIENTHEEFALFDKQGRSIGVNTVIFLVETRPRTEKDFSYIRLPFAATTHYLASVQATRDGTNYGATQSGDRDLTLEDARNTITRRVAATHKRYAKKFAT
jgi:hypothetical protein